MHYMEGSKIEYPCLYTSIYIIVHIICIIWRVLRLINNMYYIYCKPNNIDYIYTNSTIDSIHHIHYMEGSKIEWPCLTNVQISTK